MTSYVTCVMSSSCPAAAGLDVERELKQCGTM